MSRRLGVIPAAGRGTRFGHLSKRYPKCILPYKDKPIIIHNIEWLRNNGCDVVNVIINFGGEQIRSIVEFYQFDFVNIIEYDVDDGVAGSVLFGSESTESDELLVLLSDLIPLRDKITHTNDYLTVETVEDTKRWCCVDEDVDKTWFYDKMEDSPSKQALNGIYFISDKNKFDEIGCDVRIKRTKNGSEFQLSEILQRYSESKPFSLLDIPVIDFGTLPEYLKNRTVKQCREFNEVEFTEDSVVKRSLVNGEKLFREVTWYDNVPKTIQKYTPKIYSREFVSDSTYEMERIDLPSLREIFVFYDNDPRVWKEISQRLYSLVLKMKDETGKQSSKTFWKEVMKKTKDRSGGVETQFYVDLQSELSKINEPYCNVFHGDLCFSNILYDFDRSSFKVIDPRGDFYGSWLYDLAKLNHSFVGMYDVIDTEMYVKHGNCVRLYTRGKSTISSDWDDFLFEQLGEDLYWVVQILTASLFLSMIPLHAHNETNQKIFYQVYLLIYNSYKTRTRFVFQKEDMVIEIEESVRN